MMTAMVLALLASQSNELSRVQLLRSLHTIAYVSPAICAGSDQVAVQVFNVSGGDRTNVRATDFGEVEITVLGRSPAGDLVADIPIIIEGNLNHGEDSIRCLTSAARKAGATAFAVSIGTATYRFAD